MIKFFRHIRLNFVETGKTGKYFKYAIGEIVLVVIGILIALQINNWNENRKTRIAEVNKLNKLLEDLKLDSISFESNLKVLSSVHSLHKQLYNIGYKNSQELLTENPNIIRRYPNFSPPSRKTSTLLVSQLNSETIRKELIEYNDNLNRGSLEMDEFTSIVKDRIRVYLGEKEVYNLSSQFENSDKEKINMISNNDLVRISKNSDFQQILFEANFKLKSNIGGIKTILITQNSNLRSLIIKELKTY